MATDQALVARLKTLVTSCLGLEEDQFDVETNFSDMGVDSVLMVDINKAIKDEFHLEIAPTDLVDHPNFNSLAELICDRVVSSKQKSG